MHGGKPLANVMNEGGGSAGNPSSWLKASCFTYAALLMGAVVESLCMSTGHLPGWNISYRKVCVDPFPWELV